MNNENGLTVVEITMIKNYQTNNNDKIVYYFYEKYKKVILRYLLANTNGRFQNSIFDVDDFTTYIWEATKTTLSKINVDNIHCQLSTIIYKITFTNLTKWERYFSKDSHKVLNLASSLDCANRAAYVHGIAINHETKNHSNIDLNNFLATILKGKSKRKQNFIKRVIFLKSYGYSYREIAKKMHTSLRKVFYVITKLQEEGKKFFKP